MVFVVRLNYLKLPNNKIGGRIVDASSFSYFKITIKNPLACGTKGFLYSNEIDYFFKAAAIVLPISAGLAHT